MIEWSTDWLTDNGGHKPQIYYNPNEIENKEENSICLTE